MAHKKSEFWNSPPEMTSSVIEESEKKFVMKHSFRDTKVSGSGDIEKHFDLDWKINFIKGPHGGTIIGLECINDRFRWSVGAKVMIKLFAFQEPYWRHVPSFSMHTSASFNAHSPVHIVKTFSKSELKTYSDNQKALPVEIQVKIDNIEIGSDIVRKFDDDKAKEFSDVMLLVKGQKFYVNKMYLAFHSPVFNALLLGSFSESQKSEIELKDIDPYDFQVFLELIYGETSICESSFESILNLADMYSGEHNNTHAKFDVIRSSFDKVMDPTEKCPHLCSPLYECVAAIRRCEQFLMEKSTLGLQEKMDVANAFGLENAKKLFQKSIA